MCSKLLDLVDSPLDLSLFTPYDHLDQPILLLGSIIKNIYDQQRSMIRDEFKPLNIRVSTNDKTICLHGITLQPSPLFKQLYNILKSFPFDIKDVTEIYKQRLKLYNLSCNECWGYLQPHIFPIDISNIDKISNYDRYVRLNYHKLLDTDQSDLPWYSYFNQFKLFIII